MSSVVIYSQGIVCSSVCAPDDMDPEQVEAEVNGETPTGISSRWQIAHDDFANGAPNPCPCEAEPGRLHWLLTC